MQEVTKTDYILDRIESIVDRWDKANYTTENLPLKGLIFDLRQILREGKEI